MKSQPLLARVFSMQSLKGVLKLAFSLGALVFIFQYLHVETLLEKVKQLGFAVIALAFLVSVVAQLFASKRFHYYCHSKGIDITRGQSNRLYFIGVFFNLLLPGGIGGDGYVAIMLKRLYKSPLKINVQLLLSARASGLLMLMLLSAVLAYFAHFMEYIGNGYLLLCLGALFTVLSYTIAARYLLNEPYKVQLGAVFYSTGVQVCIVVMMYILLTGMQVEPALIADYIALLMFSSLLILIPISVGGLGLRELGFLYASQVVGLNAEIGVAVSLLYYSFNLVLSFIGVYFFARSKSNPAPNQNN